MLFFLLSLQAATAAAPPPGKEPPRYAECMDLATGDPSQGVTAAAKWKVEGGGMLARQCLGVAYANQKRWPSAAAAFEEAAHDAESAHDVRSSNYWAQAGNAWLAAGDPVKARAALDAALASGNLSGLALGEARLDRARVLVAAGDMAGARSDLDRALADAKADPLAWLLSATLARRQGDLPRAKTDIAEALKRAADDPQVQLEAGNIAAVDGDEAAARAAWGQVLTLAPGSATAEAARKALAQFGASEK
ncbi:tetratricopeptide (TPR) repeat protein [Sphingomonas naasensis]|uniref:Tetratricopeptide repeat protein n=1 Tax=Sphingomonas naasensis TaxID=1344951 RepID=A0A4S1WIS7_9SPHN|nr:tetratricopeptide repeat protein [Sphingomonas naasensis]NIJ21743.1 tetratricopeptide (TPR) repeat protein [Sphingomonas naasensis]TGX40826.1 tetratricopeptide repeat protein [Sphingomonas naasensis]